MNIAHYPASAFPDTHAAIVDRLGDTVIPNSDSVVLFGGSARNSLFEATGNKPQAIRDIDLVPIGDNLSDEDFRALHHELNPDDSDQNIRVFRFPSIDGLLSGNVDFTINEAVITLGEAMELAATTDAIEAVRKHIILPTAGRIAVTKELQAGGETTRKQFLRNETDMPARAASFVARLRVAGVDFSYDLLDHPRPAKPFDPTQPRELEGRAHPFYLGLMINKTLKIDEIEREAWDITGTGLMLEIYKEMGLITNGVEIRTIKDIVAFCNATREAKPATPFGESAVARLVSPASRAPEPKTD